MEERILMSQKDLNRLDILTKVKERRLTQIEGAKILGISDRQFRRLSRKLEAFGPKGIISKKVGAPSNHRLPQWKKDLVQAFFQREEYRDFGPTLAHEYMMEEGRRTISISSVRTIMIENGLWHPNKVRELKVHPLRMRRPRKGELIQLDGSEHDWFEGRGERCSLLVYIDDATSETMHLKFVKSENLFDYYAATREYLEMHGRPEAFYPDKHAVFRVNREGALSGDGMTQFGRAMKELDIKLICANSPQAKGRVERRNRDFQDRLVKAMRIAKISNIEAANAFLPSFLQKFNQQFAKKPLDPHNAHRLLLPEHNLDRIFCAKYKRQLSKNLTLQYNNVIYQILADRREYTLRQAEVIVLESRDGEVTIEHRGKKLTAVPYHKMQARTEEVSAKELVDKLKQQPVVQNNYRPGHKHPWKRGPRGFSTKPRSALACCC